MKDRGIVPFLFEVMWKEHFGSKYKMAEELGVTYRTLQYNFTHFGHGKGGFYALKGLMDYLYDKDISLDEYFLRYRKIEESLKKGAQFPIWFLWLNMYVKKIGQI